MKVATRPYSPLHPAAKRPTRVFCSPTPCPPKMAPAQSDDRQCRWGGSSLQTCHGPGCWEGKRGGVPQPRLLEWRHWTMRVGAHEWPWAEHLSPHCPLQKTRVQHPSPVQAGRPARESRPRLRPRRPHGGLGLESDPSGEICDLQKSLPDTAEAELDGENSQ